MRLRVLREQGQSVKAAFSETGRTVPSETVDLLALGLAEAPFAALLFRPDAKLGLLWRNREHARMSLSEGRDVAGLPMFEAFPPSRDAEGSAAVAAVRETVARVTDSGQPAELGPARFDLPAPSGIYGEHHRQMHFAPIHVEGRLVAILQTARGR